MDRRSFLAALPALATGLLAPSVAARLASAQEAPVTLRIATLAPRGSAWHRVFTAWGNTLRTQTNGRLTINVMPAGAGDELDLVRRMRAREIDGASFTAIGIGQIARPVLVLQAPGVFETYEHLDRARTRMDAELRGLFEQNGATLMGWSDYGQGRIFSTRPIRRPADFREARPWVLENDPVFPELLRVIGATGGVPLPIGQVMGALEQGRIDTVVASATAASALQWHTRLNHVMQQSNAVLLGATLFSKEKVESLPADLQTALRETGRQAHETLQRTVRRDDDRYYQTLSTRPGMTIVDASQYEAEWRQVAQQTRERLVGRVYTRELLDRAIAAAR